jgi:hypothetical protein
MVPIDQHTQSVVPWNTSEHLLLLFTDGLSDALSGDGGSSGGEAHLVADVVRLCRQPLTDILDHLFAQAAQGRTDFPTDDRTALLVRG